MFNTTITKTDILKKCNPKPDYKSLKVNNFLISYREICKSFNRSVKSDESYSLEDREFFGQILQILYAEGMLCVVNKSPEMNIPHLDAQYFITEKGIKEITPWYKKIEIFVMLATVFTGVSAIVQVYELAIK